MGYWILSEQEHLDGWVRRIETIGAAASMAWSMQTDADLRKIDIDFVNTRTVQCTGDDHIIVFTFEELGF